MNPTIDILKKVGALLTNDHFVGTSGLHFDTYINKDALYMHTEEVSKIGQLFAEKYINQNIEVVVGPAIGGIILSQWTARCLTKTIGKEVLSVYTEKAIDGNQIFMRGYDDIVKNKRVLIVEDLTTTGGSIVKVINAVKQAGGEIVGVCVMVNKNQNNVNCESIGIPFQSLAEYKVEIYTAENCPLCKAGIPINAKVGHGKKFSLRTSTVK